MDEAHPQLIAREAATNSARAFDPQLAVLESIVDYGTNMIMRVLHMADARRVRDCVLVAVLCKQVVTMLDGVTVLLRAGCALAANVPARSLWEADLQMAWIIQADSERRAQAFWVAHLLREMKRCESELPGSDYRNKVGETSAWRPEAEIREELDQIRTALSQPACAALSAGQEKARFWAEPLGARSRRQMAEQLGRWQEYDVLYSLLSGSAHGEAPKWHMRGDEGLVHLRFIRDPREMRYLVGLCATWTVRSYMCVLEKYRPEELTNFSRRYAEQWRSALHALRSTPGT